MENVRHIPEQNRFVVDYQGAQAILQYAIFPKDTKAVLDITSTYVPPEFRGKGLAEKLVRAALGWGKEQGYELQASCWYAAKFIR
jgi:uncharacterized protein